jgi:hypothetical protein
LVLYAGQVEYEYGSTGIKRRGFVSGPFDEEKRIQTPPGRYSNSHFEKSNEYDEYKKLEYLNTRLLTASGFRDVLERVSEVEGLFPTKEVLGDALCRSSLRYRNYTEEGLQNIYNGWAKSTQRMYC